MNIRIVDARRLLCPMPVIRTQDAVSGLQTGDSLQVLCTDPGAVQDIPAWCRVQGHQVRGIIEQDAQFIITIQVGDTAQDTP